MATAEPVLNFVKEYNTDGFKYRYRIDDDLLSHELRLGTGQEKCHFCTNEIYEGYPYFLINEKDYYCNFCFLGPEDCE